MKLVNITAPNRLQSGVVCPSLFFWFEKDLQIIVSKSFNVDLVVTYSGTRLK